VKIYMDRPAYIYLLIILLFVVNLQFWLARRDHWMIVYHQQPKSLNVCE